jgi:hypothetical protein
MEAFLLLIRVRLRCSVGSVDTIISRTYLGGEEVGCGRTGGRGRFNTPGTEEERRVHEGKKEKAQAEGLSYGEWRRW